MVEIEIDGKKIAVEQGATIIEAADELGVHIPRFCYHKKLSIAANCRMCLVEVEKSRKPLPACATPVTQDMKVLTQSNMALQAQRDVMEFLLINHPLDCPVCDQGGMCDLQDLAMAYGDAHSYFEQAKHAVAESDIGPLVETEMTRCINCTRCVRFGEEIAGMRELGVIGRGGSAEIGTYVTKFLRSELSGNITDICPVGALTTKPNRYAYRGWEVFETPHVAPHDCVGSNTYIHARVLDDKLQRKVYAVVPRENEAINESWISDRDRFAYLGVQSRERLTGPMQKINGQWEPVEWQVALQQITQRLGKIIEQDDGTQIAAAVSPSATLEECYLLQKWLRQLGCHNIDHRCRQVDCRDQNAMPQFPGLAIDIASIEEQKNILLVGSDIRTEQPLLAHRINKAFAQGAKVMAINPVAYRHAFSCVEQMITADLVTAIVQVTKAVAQIAQQNIPAALEGIEVSPEAEQIAQRLHQPDAIIFIGEIIEISQQGSVIRQCLGWIAQWSGAQLAWMTSGANAAGAWLAGCIPHRGVAGQQLNTEGKGLQEFFTSSPVQAYILHQIEPEHDVSCSAAALQALEQASMVVCLNTFATDAMRQYADFILPLAPFTEQGGTLVNVTGAWQSYIPVSAPQDSSKPGWKVIRALASFMHVDDMNYTSLAEVTQAVEAECAEVSCGTYQPAFVAKLPEVMSSLYRLGTWSMYTVDGLVRRATALRETEHDVGHGVYVHSELAVHLGCKAGDQVRVTQQGQSRVLPLYVNSAVAKEVLWCPSGFEQVAGFGSASGEITIEREAE